MLKNKQFRFCFSLLVLMVFAGAGSAWAQRFAGQPRSKKVIAATVAVIIALGLV